MSGIWTLFVAVFVVYCVGFGLLLGEVVRVLTDREAL